jgi:carbamoyl-phosphate synthase large subunit
VAREITVLVTGVGGGVGQSVMKGLRLAHRTTARRYRIIGCDANPLAAGLYRCDRGYHLPTSESPEYIDRIVKVCEMEGVNAVIPGSDPEVLKIAECKGELEEAGVRVIASDAETVKIGYDKWLTYKFLRKNKVMTPKTYLGDDVGEAIIDIGYPLVIKPRRGSASKGLFIARDKDELKVGLRRCVDPIIQEYLIPENWPIREFNLEELSRQVDEYSIEVLVDSGGQILGSIGNWREMVKGVPTRAIIVDYPDLLKGAREVVKKLKALGPVNLQARMTRSGTAFFELNVRFSGTTAVRCAVGFNGPDAMVRDVVLGEEVKPAELEYDRQVVEMRYKDEVYIRHGTYERMLSEGVCGPDGETQSYF